MMEKNQRSLKKKGNKCNKGILQAECWFIVKQTATVCSMVEKKIQRRLKKSATSVTKVFYMQYGALL